MYAYFHDCNRGRDLSHRSVHELEAQLLFKSVIFVGLFRDEFLENFVPLNYWLYNYGSSLLCIGKSNCRVYILGFFIAWTSAVSGYKRR